MKNIFLVLLLASIFPANAFCDDRQIVSDAQDVLQDLSGAHEVEIAARLGVVTITGYVSSEADKDKLESAIRVINDVDEVKNEVSVKNVKASLSHHRACSVDVTGIILNDGRFEAVCSGDEITLSGEVSSRNEINKVGDQVAALYPNRKLINNIQVRSDIPDEVIRAKILDSLRSESLIPPTVFLSVKSGVARYSGTVSNHRVIDQILSRTIMMDGVKDALSDVTIE